MGLVWMGFDKIKIVLHVFLNGFLWIFLVFTWIWEAFPDLWPSRLRRLWWAVAGKRRKLWPLYNNMLSPGLDGWPAGRM